MFAIFSQIDSKAPRYDDEGNQLPESTFPTYVNLLALRAFYRRNDGKMGTRLTFKDGGGIAVAESVAQVSAAVERVAGAAYVSPAPEGWTYVEGGAVASDEERLALPSPESRPAAEEAPAATEEANAARRRRRSSQS